MLRLRLRLLLLQISLKSRQVLRHLQRSKPWQDHTFALQWNTCIAFACFCICQKPLVCVLGHRLSTKPSRCCIKQTLNIEPWLVHQCFQNTLLNISLVCLAQHEIRIDRIILQVEQELFRLTPFDDFVDDLHEQLVLMG